MDYSTWVIYNRETGLYWSNEDGWQEAISQTRFSGEEKGSFPHIPLGGEWNQCLGEVSANGITLCFVELGEGFSGDYNPDDPEDEELLRVDVWDREDKYANGDTSYSYCTMCRANLTEAERRAILIRWLVIILNAGRDYIKHTVERLTWEENTHKEGGE